MPTHQTPKQVVKSHTPQQTQQRTQQPISEPNNEAIPYDLAEEFNYNEVQTILSWHAAGRPFKQRSSEFFFNAFLIMMAVEIILFLFSQYLLMLVVFSLVFLAFALAIVPPRPFYYKITTEGVRIEDHVFIWEELYDFYFMRQHDQDILHIRTKTFFPGELIVSLGDITKEQIKATLLPFLPYREYVEPTFSDQMANWLEKNFPLEKKTS